MYLFSNAIARASFNKSQETNIFLRNLKKMLQKLKGETFLPALIFCPIKITYLGYLSIFCPLKQDPGMSMQS